ncbi:hypothetical protein [Sulfurihydrogenibium sp.]|jgi:hypothetical protein|uniref:hypothetical protein n=1 Tax=Sulfurihydrogenibium sp. TaxID=2053621 RepID=UPI0026140B89|nr:hypothetical protein [Sulfurihydrogenibium sp.]
MEEMYQPFEILLTDDGELVVLVEPEKNLISLLQKESLNVEVDIDVDYDDEDEELYLLVTAYIDGTEIFFALPYGESWEALAEKGAFTVAFISEADFEKGNSDNTPTMTIQLDDLLIGFVEGCQRTAEVLLGESEEFEERE